MILLLSLLIISLALMLAILYFKRVELAGGREMPFFGDRSDNNLRLAYLTIKKFFRHWNWRTATLFYHFILEKIENFFLWIYRYFRNKFSRHVDMVRGTGSLNEDKKASSFYLKNIEKHKNSLKE